MKIRFTLLLLVLGLSSFTNAQVYINDDFSTWPQGWTFYGSPCTGQYSAVQDNSTGAVAPCAKINKSGCLAPCSGSLNAGITKTVTFTQPATEFIFSVNYEAFSGTASSSVTNAHLRITDNTNNIVLLSTCLICGGFTESGWKTFSDTVSIGCNGSSSVTVDLFTVDAWISSPWCKITRFDNPKLTVTQTSAVAPIVLQIDSVYDATCIACPDGQIMLNYSGGSGAGLTVSWTPAVGQLNGNTITGLPADSYSVCVMDTNNCEICKVAVVSEPATGISAFSSIDINIYPVPLISSSKIKIPEELYNKNIASYIFDSQGRKLTETMIRNEDIILHRNDFAAGIYYLKLITSEGTLIYSGKFNVE